jgi:uncharacterized protein
MRTILLLTMSNLFMTIAWYGHLKQRGAALWKVILISWGIAYFEYCFQVPANRIGSYQFNATQLKTIQKIITLSIFPVFSVFYIGDKFKWNQGAGFAFIVVAAFLFFTSGEKLTLRFRSGARAARPTRLAFERNTEAAAVPVQSQAIQTWCCTQTALQRAAAARAGGESLPE